MEQGDIHGGHQSRDPCMLFDAANEDLSVLSVFYTILCYLE